MITASVFKSGNSVVIVVPKQVVNYLKLARGDLIRYTIKPDNRVELTRLEDDIKGTEREEKT